MKRISLLILVIVLGCVTVGCSLPTRESINEAKNTRDGADRPLNERDSTDE